MKVDSIYALYANHRNHAHMSLRNASIAVNHMQQIIKHVNISKRYLSDFVKIMKTNYD